MNRIFLIAGAGGMAISIMLGAFGAHALKERLTELQLQNFETAVRYLAWHAMALILLGILSDKVHNNLLNISGYCMMMGILFFSGSIMLLSCKDLLGIQSWNFLGPVTPLGGVLFIVAWIFVILAILKSK